ncbi:phosphotransferase enzyme family protein [Nonomuraea sp. NPDC050227]|uniref:phosphotransferase enzyme family protein n=1 Tax=Nonomuraea sp. NPDC050227 TaxID=3364360 RepID=UPI003790DE02
MSWKESDDPLVPKILRDEFRLGAVGGVEWYDRESTNGVFRAQTTHGPVIIKRLGRPGTIEWLEFQADTLQALHECGFPAQPLLRCPDGRRTVLAHDEQWQVTPFIAGRPFTPGSEADVDVAAACLSRLHGLSALAPEPSPTSPIRDAEAWLHLDETDLSEVAATIQELAPHTPSEVFDKYRAAWQRARQTLSLEGYQALPHRLTHGEYVGSNLLYGSDDVICIVDWDGLQVRPRLADLARASLFFPRRVRGGIEVIESLVPRFLRVATQSEPLLDNERDAIIPFLELYFVPIPAFLRMIAERNPTMLDWYLGWSSAAAGRVRQILTRLLEGC